MTLRATNDDAPFSGARRLAVIDLAALVQNIESLTVALGVDQSLVDLRASAYGHGLTAVGRASQSAGITRFLVSNDDDAVELRTAGVSGDILTTQEFRDAPIADDLGPGIYGLASDNATAAVMTLSAEVISVKPVAAGTGVSYGYTYRSPQNTRLALVSIGYADGVPRLGSNTAHASIGGSIAPVVGRIAMDQLVLDIGQTEAFVGDTATLFGDPASGVPAALDWAAATGRSGVALTTGLGRRIRRVYRGLDE